MVPVSDHIEIQMVKLRRSEKETDLVHDPTDQGSLTSIKPKLWGALRQVSDFYKGVNIRSGKMPLVDFI